MADVQPENGFTKVAHELLEMIPRFKFNGTQLRLILVVLRYTYGFSRKDHDMSLSFMVNATGLVKTQIDRELKQLIESRVLFVTEPSTYTKSRKIGLNKNYDEWLVEQSDSQQKRVQSAKTLTVSKNAEEQSANLRTRTVSKNADQDRYSFIDNSKDNIVPFAEIIEYLNAKAGTNYRPSSKATQKHINARWNEKRTLSDFKTVIDKKCAEWKGTDMEKYLCPETLFGTKFEKYLNQKIVIHGGRGPAPAPSVTVSEEERERLAELTRRQAERNKSSFAINQ